MSRYQYNYIITIKQPDYKTADAVAFLMMILAVAFFAFVAVKYRADNAYHNAVILYAVLAAFIILWSVYSFVSARERKGIAYYRIALLAAAVGWFIQPVSNYWMGGLYVIAALLERQVKFPQEIGVDEEGITFNTLPAKEHGWKEISNILLKEGILTVDYKNNKLFQQEIESEVSSSLEKEFNQYCRTKLVEARENIL